MVLQNFIKCDYEKGVSDGKTTQQMMRCRRFLRFCQKSYDVYGPKIYQGTGCFSDTDIVRYGLLNSWEELVWDQKSDYSFKEVLFPVSETILYFTEDEMKTADGVARQRLIFLKSCDFHALKRLDEMYLKTVQRIIITEECGKIQFLL